MVEMTVGTPTVMVVAGMVIVMVELSVAVAMPVEVSEELELEVAEEVEDAVVLVPVRVTVMTEEVVFWAEAVPRAMMAAARTEVVVNFMAKSDVLVGVERLSKLR